MQCCKLILHTPVPACRAGYDPRQMVKDRLDLRFPWTEWTAPLRRTLQHLATSGPPTALTTIDGSDRGGTPQAPYVWPNAVKQAHNFDTHLPDALAEYERHKWGKGWAWRQAPLLHSVAAMCRRALYGERWGRRAAHR